MLIAEDLLLLLTGDQSGKLLVPSNKLDIALGGALLVELAIAGRVIVDPTWPDQDSGAYSGSPDSLESRSREISARSLRI